MSLSQNRVWVREAFGRDSFSRRAARSVNVPQTEFAANTLRFQGLLSPDLKTLGIHFEIHHYPKRPMIALIRLTILVILASCFVHATEFKSNWEGRNDAV